MQQVIGRSLAKEDIVFTCQEVPSSISKQFVATCWIAEEVATAFGVPEASRSTEGGAASSEKGAEHSAANAMIQIFHREGSCEPALREHVASTSRFVRGVGASCGRVADQIPQDDIVLSSSRVFALFKPKGVVTTNDPTEGGGIMAEFMREVVEREQLGSNLQFIGRLDQDTTG